MKNEKNNSKVGKLFIIAAPSGAGKTSLVNETIKKLTPKYQIEKIITYTTRPARQGEINGKDYHFLSAEDFDKKAKSDFFLEVTTYNDKKYGSPKSISTDILNGKSFVIIADIPGVKSLSKLVPDAISIWITVEKEDELRKRLIKRGSLSHSQMEERLNLAKEEIKEAEKARLFKYKLVNDHFDQSVLELAKVIISEIEGR